MSQQPPLNVHVPKEQKAIHDKDYDYPSLLIYQLFPDSSG